MGSRRRSLCHRGQSVPKLFREAAADPYEYIDDFSLETAPWLLRRGDIRLALYNASVSISYSIRSAWAARLENRKRSHQRFRG